MTDIPEEKEEDEFVCWALLLGTLVCGIAALVIFLLVVFINIWKYLGAIGYAMSP